MFYIINNKLPKILLKKKDKSAKKESLITRVKCM